MGANVWEWVDSGPDDLKVTAGEVGGMEKSECIEPIVH